MPATTFGYEFSAMTLNVDNLFDTLDDIKKDDLLLMSMGKHLGCHVGIYVGDQMVLHHQVGRLSSKDLLDSQMQKSIYKRYRHVENN